MGGFFVLKQTPEISFWNQIRSLILEKKLFMTAYFSSRNNSDADVEATLRLKKKISL